MIFATFQKSVFCKTKNIGLDKQTFNGRLSYSWSPKKNRTTNFDLLNLQYVRNLNPGNYFNVYQNSFNRLETIALDTYPTPTSSTKPASTVCPRHDSACACHTGVRYRYGRHVTADVDQTCVQWMSDRF